MDPTVAGTERHEPQGLSQEEAAARLARYGRNEVPEAPRHPLWTLLARFSGPVPWMLEAAIVLEIVAGHVIEAMIIAALVVFNGLLSSFQEGKAQGALALLRQRLAVRARVRRDGNWQLIDAGLLVPGDLVHVRAGDLVPADVAVIAGAVRADQSVLTGESAEIEIAAGGRLYAGSLLRHGEATGEVVATGSRTYYGRTAELVRTARTASHLEETILRIVWTLLAMDGALVVAILAYGIAAHLALQQLLPFVLILMVASVPVALPATFTLATALGALQLARAGVLVTRLSAIEEAAAMDLLCADKTGTITRNCLSVVGVRPRGTYREEDVLALAAAASDVATQDPIDLAVLAAADRVGGVGRRVAFVPFDPAIKRSEAVVERDGEHLRVLKGAPQVLAAMAEGSPDVGAEVAALAGAGARVLAVASGSSSLELVGLIALADPARPDSAALVRELRGLGVRVVMVTGDAEPTALAVAREVGIGVRTGSVTALRSSPGGEIDFDVLAGVLPEDKLRLVEVAQRAGHVVGMTGDGVNDAPALKRAEVESR